MKRRLDISSLILFSSSSYVVDIAQYVVCSLCLQKVNCICSLSSQAGGFPEESTVKAPTPSVYTPDLWPFCMKPCDWPLLDQLIALLPTPTWSLGQALPMPNAFSSLGLGCEGCSNVWIGQNTANPPHPSWCCGTSFRELFDFSYGRPTSWYLQFLLFWKCKEHLNRHVKW